jgi:hypothetical protein
VHKLWAQSDASWGNQNEKSSKFRGISGMICGLNKNTIFAQSKIQSLTTPSTTESEVIAGSDLAGAYLNIRNLLAEIVEKTEGHFGRLDAQIAHAIDNRSAVLRAARPAVLKKLRHLSIRNNLLRELVQINFVKPRWIAGAEMLADVLTKVINGKNWHDALKKLGLTIGAIDGD